MNSTIRTALEHVQRHHPEVTTVVYSRSGNWLYCDDDFEAPAFSDAVDPSLLEDAADVAYEIGLPCAFSLDQEEAMQ